MTGEPETHDRWVEIDWVEQLPYEPKVALSYSVVKCACSTPWQHYP